MEYARIDSVPSKGEGLVASRAISLKDVIYTTDTAIIQAIATANIKFFCYHCCASSAPDSNQFSVSNFRNARLQRCTGCQVAHFCGKSCQTAAWKSYHKFECKMMGRLSPRVPHESVRAIQRFCLQRDNNLIDDEQWEKILGLMSHMDEFQKAGGDQWATLMLYAKATHEYSATKVPLPVVLKLMCILKCNGLILQTTYGDPIGVFIDLTLVKVNHSCQTEGNVFVHRPRSPGRAIVQLLPLREIAEGEELTFPYDDFHDDVEKRQAALQKAYFFTCKCAACVRDTDAKRALENTNPRLAASIKQWQDKAGEVLALVREQLPPAESSSSNKTVTKLQEVAVEAEDKDLVAASAHCYGRIIHELKILYISQQQEYEKGIICALREYFIVGPLMYTTPLHPTNLVNALYLLHQLALLDETYIPNHGHPEMIVRARKNIEAKGFGRQSLAYWRAKICEDLRVKLSSCSRDDMAMFFEQELANITTGYRSHIRDLLENDTAEKSNEELSYLIGPFK